MSFYCEWRALIGPRYDHYNWWTLNYGATTELGFNTFLAQPILPNSTVITPSSLTYFSTPGGGLWIGPGATGEQWAYFRYTGTTGSQFGGLTKQQIDTEYTGNHSINSIVYQWYPVDGDDGTYILNEMSDSSFAAVGMWTLKLKGVNFPQWALRNNHLCVVQTRTSPTGTWAIQNVGVIDGPAVRDDWQGLREWTVTVRSLDFVYGKNPVKGVKVGQLNVAKLSQASASMPLVNPFEERHRGEFKAAEPSFDAGVVIDEDPGTLWIGERYIGSQYPIYRQATEDGNNGKSGGTFHQLYLNPPPGTPPGARWIEIIVLSGGLNGWTIVSSNGNNQTEICSLAGAGDVENDPDRNQSKLIICEDQEVFTRLNPLAQPGAIIERRAWFRHIRAAGGDLWLRQPQLGFWYNRVAWGDGNYGSDPWPDHEDAPERAFGGGMIRAPGPGENIRYMFSGNAQNLANSGNTHWRVELIKNAGYEITTSPDEWVMITLPPLGLKLTADISFERPSAGETLRISNDGGPSTAGLPDSGTLLFAAEQITYNGKTTDGVTVVARGANSTIADDHKAGDTVYLLVSGIATDGQLVKSVGWYRYLGLINPKNFTFRYSLLAGNARDPGQPDWQNDWQNAVVDFDNYTAPQWEYFFSPSIRAKHLLLQIERMNVDPARARVNEIRAILDPAAYSSDLWLPDGQPSFAVLRAIILQSGYPVDAISYENANSPTISDVITADDTMWTVAVDFAEYANCQIRVRRDSKIELYNNPLWTNTLAPSFTWTDENTAAVDVNWQNGIGVNQVKLKWKRFNASESGEQSYPSTPQAVGEPLELDEVRYANDAAMLAAIRRKFTLARYSTLIDVESADAQPTFRPGGVCKTQWRLHGQMNALDRTCFVVEAQHSIEENQWYTAASLQQVGREQED